MTITFDDLNFGNISAQMDESRFCGGMSEFVYFPKLLSLEKGQGLLKLLFSGNAAHVMRKDFQMPMSGHTPRHMSVISGNRLNAIPELVDLYRDPHLLAVLNEVMWHSSEFEHFDGDNEVVPYGDMLENMVATRLEKIGDTHGRHVDVPAITMIFCLSNVPEGMGGELVFDSYARSCVYRRRQHLKAGDGYIFNSSLHPHEVTPLSNDGERIILNFTYDFRNRRNPPIQDGSAHLLFA